MSTTIDTTVREARRRLRDTSGLSGGQIDDAQKVLDAFYAARPPPRQQCVACQSMIWSEHGTADGGASWACDNCHRPATLTSENWHAQQAREREAAEAHLAATTAAAPKPRATLHEALAARAAASAEVAKLDRAVPVARAAAAEAQLRHDRAVENAEAVNAHSAAHLAETFYNGTKPSDSARTAAAARGELNAATDALVIAKNAKTILDTKVKDARSALAVASDRARKAAIAVLAAEMLEGLLSYAVESRAQYLDAVGQLAWLLRSRAIPNNDARARQLLGEANVPPSSWPEAATAGNQQMEAAVTALLTDPDAIL